MLGKRPVYKGQAISASETNRLWNELERSRNLSVAAPLELHDSATGPMIRWNETTIRAVINFVEGGGGSSSASSSGLGTAYGWEEISPFGDGTWTFTPEGRYGTPITNPAYEANGEPVDVGTFVLLHPGFNGEYIFWAGGTGSGGSGTAAEVIETDVTCEDGVLLVYQRSNNLSIVNGNLVSVLGDWDFVRVAGCCDCAALSYFCTARIASFPFTIPIEDITANGRLGVIMVFVLEPNGNFPNALTGWTIAYSGTDGDDVGYIVYTKTLNGTETNFSLTETGGSQYSAVATALEPGVTEVDFDVEFFNLGGLGGPPPTPTTFQTPANAIRLCAYGYFNLAPESGFEAPELAGCNAGGNNVAVMTAYRYTQQPIVEGGEIVDWIANKGWGMSILYARVV